jgi:hypothetical protein
MPDETTYEGWFEITNQTDDSVDSNAECSCGVVVWDVEGHKRFHQLLGQVVTDKRGS